MTSFLRFFILTLTPLLAVTVSFGPAVLYGLVATVVLMSVTALVFALRDQMGESGQLWSTLGLSVLLVTLVDLITTIALPGVRAAWGLYLNLLAFSPLVLLPLEKAYASDLGPELSVAFKTGIFMTLLFSATALVRESLGLGTLTLVPNLASWNLPFLKQYPITIIATGAGGFFLAAAGVVAYRALRPRLLAFPTLETTTERPVRVERRVQVRDEPQTPATRPETPKTEPLGESGDAWGENLAGAVASMPAETAGKRRLLVIGSGNGELAYYLSMLCLDQSKGDKIFDFRVRGVDHFSTRIDTAVKGVYRDHHIDFIPKSVRDAWMTKGQGEDRVWRVDNEPRLHVQFDVADFQQGPMFFSQSCHLIVLNQGIEFVSDEKKIQLLKITCDHLLPGGALIVMGNFRRELLPEGMKRTGTAVFRKS